MLFKNTSSVSVFFFKSKKKYPIYFIFECIYHPFLLFSDLCTWTENSMDKWIYILIDRIESNGNDNDNNAFNSHSIFIWIKNIFVYYYLEYTIAHNERVSTIFFFCFVFFCFVYVTRVYVQSKFYWSLLLNAYGRFEQQLLLLFVLFIKSSTV